MKLLWFHLAPYPELPDDFRDRHRSVWVDIDSGLFDPGVGAEALNLYLDQLEHADACGFDGICVNEHHSNAYGLMPSPNLMAAALTRNTSNAAIVVMGNSLALYNPPIRVAEEFAMLDCLSRRAAGGRLPRRHADGHDASPTARTRPPCAAGTTRRTTSSCGRGRPVSRSRSTASSTSSAT